MKRWFWKTAVSLFTLLLATISCGSAEVESVVVPEVTGPAFVLFFTDN